MVKVDFGTGADEAHFKKCITQAECADPKPTMYPPSPVHTVTASSFADRVPEAIAYLSKRAFSNADMNRQLVWIEANQADGDTAATHFLKNFEPIWPAWFSADIASMIGVKGLALPVLKSITNQYFTMGLLNEIQDNPADDYVAAFVRDLKRSRSLKAPR